MFKSRSEEVKKDISRAMWLFDDSEKDSNVTVNVITVSSTPLGVAKEGRIEYEKEGKDRASQKSPKNKTE